MYNVQNGQTHLKNLPANAARFLKCPTILYFMDLRAKRFAGDSK